MRNRLILCLGAIVCLGMLSMAAIAQNPILNPSFESGLADWTAYGYGTYSSNPAVKTVGAGGFDVLFPDDGAPDGTKVCGYQGWWSAGTGGVRQTFTAPGSGFFSIAARAYSLDGGMNAIDKGNRVRAAAVEGASTSRDDVVVWTDCTWGVAWNDIVVPIPAAGQYTLYIEHFIPSHEAIFSSLWDHVRWSDTAPVAIVAGPTVTNLTDTSATIEWDTDVASNSILNYDTDGPPYDNTLSDPAMVTHHAITLTGLTAGVTYHYQVKSEAPPREPATSAGSSFRAPTPAQPTLANGDFEATSGGTPTLDPWYPFGPIDGLYGPGTPNPTDFGIPARSQSHFLGAVASWGSKDMGGALQRVVVIPGKTYVASAWIWTQSDLIDEGTGSLVPSYWTDATARIGIDPTGGIDQNAESVVWSHAETNPLEPWGSSQDPQTFAQLGHKQIFVTTEIPAGVTAATVFLQEHQGGSNGWRRVGFDDVTFAEALPSATLGEAKTKPAGWAVDLTNNGQGLIVTKTEGIPEGSPSIVEAPYCWVQEDDRSSGMKVRLDAFDQQQIDAIQRGCRITLKGTTTSRALNDFYYGDAEILATEVTIVSTGNADPKPVGIISKSAGGKAIGIQRGPIGGAGANNVGLLVKLAGSVAAIQQDPTFTSPDRYYFSVDDGGGLSHPFTVEPGVRVWHPYDDLYWTLAPSPSLVPGEAMVSVTGVLCLEVCDPTPGEDGKPNGSGDEVLIPTVRLRDGRDIKVE